MNAVVNVADSQCIKPWRLVLLHTTVVVAAFASDPKFRSSNFINLLWTNGTGWEISLQAWYTALQWLATAKFGGAGYRIAPLQWRGRPTGADGTPTEQTFVLREDSKGRLWVGTLRSGVVVLRQGKVVLHIGA